MNTSQQIFSTITSEGELQISLVERDVPQPKENQVVVKVEAAPVNPSDMWPLLGPADISKAQLQFDDAKKEMTAPVHKGFLPRIHSRLDVPQPIGNEGAGTVVAAGSGEQAQAMMGKTVAILTGATYSQYACVPVHACLVHKEGTTARQAAASFVNPLTALGMVETMRLENHTGLIHTAAASNLGQILNKICLAEDVPLINIVRKQEQTDLLKGQGAKIVLNSSDEDFMQQLVAAVDASGATLAFDAIGGGELTSHILTAMETVGSKDAKGLNTYGSSHAKQVYIYGGLDFSPTILNRAYGMTWGIGGWLLNNFLARVGMEKTIELQKRVAQEITTTFAADFTQEITLKDVMTPEKIMAFNAKQTGQKFLVNPTLEF